MYKSGNETYSGTFTHDYRQTTVYSFIPVCRCKQCMKMSYHFMTDIKYNYKIHLENTVNIYGTPVHNKLLFKNEFT